MARGILFALLVVGVVISCCGSDFEPPDIGTVERITKLVDDYKAKLDIRRAHIRASFEQDIEANNNQVRDLVQTVGIRGDVQKITDVVWSQSDAIWAKIRDNFDINFDDMADDRAKLDKEIRDAISPEMLQASLVKTYLDEEDNSQAELLKTIQSIWTQKKAVFQADLGQFVSAMQRLHEVALESEDEDYQASFERLLVAAYDVLKADVEDYFDDWMLELNSSDKRNKALTLFIVSQ